MGGAVPFQETVAQTMCVDCPIAEITNEYWRQNVHEGIVYDPQHLHEILGIFRDEAQAMRPEGLAEKLNSIHNHLLDLFPAGPEEARFEAVPGSESVLLRRGHQNPVEEQALSAPARMFLHCMRRLMSSACPTALVDEFDRKMQEELAFGLGRDVGMGAGVLEAIGKHGSDEDVHEMVSKIMRIADNAGSSALRGYIDTHARDHQGVIDRAVILAAALFLRDKQE